MKRIVTVVLISKVGEREFDFLHAEKLLRDEAKRRANKPSYDGWQLPEGSRYYFNGQVLQIKNKEKHGTFIKPNKGKHKVAIKEGSDSDSGKAS